MKKRILTIIVLIFLFAAYGCSDNSETTDTESSGDTVTETSADIITEAEYDFAVTKEDNAGEVINILISKHAEYEFLVESETGEVVDDAVYNRNRAVEELLGVKLNFESRANFGGTDTNDWKNAIRQSILADDDSWQIINGICVWTSQLIPDGLFINMNDIESINFDNPWWVPGFPLGGDGIYCAFNDAAFSLYKDLYVMFFNKEIIESYKLEDPYELVRSGEWTVDKFIELSKDIALDLNKDNEIDYENDRIAYLYKHAANRAFLISTENSIVEDVNGTYKIKSLSERLVNTYDKMRSFLYSNESVYCSQEADYITLAQPFIEGRVLFMNNCLCAVEGMRDMSDDFGIIPLPKYDESQEEYHSQIATSTQAFYIPMTVDNPALVGKVSEALAYYSYKDVIPKYYEVAMKDKYTRDDNVKEMLDIIRESAVSSFEFLYSTLFTSGWPNDIFNYAINDTDLTSTYASKINGWQATLDDLSTKELP